MQIILDASARRDDRLAWLAGRYNAFAFHQPNDMPGDPSRDSAAGPIKPEIAEEIRAIRRRVKLAYDTEKARVRNGR